MSSRPESAQTVQVTAKPEQTFSHTQQNKPPQSEVAEAIDQGGVSTLVDPKPTHAVSCHQTQATPGSIPTVIETTTPTEVKRQQSPEQHQTQHHNLAETQGTQGIIVSKADSKPVKLVNTPDQQTGTEQSLPLSLLGKLNIEMWQSSREFRETPL